MRKHLEGTEVNTDGGQAEDATESGSGEVEFDGHFEIGDDDDYIDSFIDVDEEDEEETEEDEENEAEEGAEATPGSGSEAEAEEGGDQTEAAVGTTDPRLELIDGFGPQADEAVEVLKALREGDGEAILAKLGTLSESVQRAVVGAALKDVNAVLGSRYGISPDEVEARLTGKYHPGKLSSRLEQLLEVLPDEDAEEVRAIAATIQAMADREKTASEQAKQAREEAWQLILAERGEILRETVEAAADRIMAQHYKLTPGTNEWGEFETELEIRLVKKMTEQRATSRDSLSSFDRFQRAVLAGDKRDAKALKAVFMRDLAETATHVHKNFLPASSAKAAVSKSATPPKSEASSGAAKASVAVASKGRESAGRGPDAKGTGDSLPDFRDKDALLRHQMAFMKKKAAELGVKFK